MSLTAYSILGKLNMNLWELQMIIKPIVTALAALALASAANAVTLTTGTSISSPTNFNGFEGIGSTSSFPSNTPYTEGGITVTYVDPATIISSTYAATHGGQGNFGWSVNPTGNGYTDVKLSSGADFQAISFLVGTTGSSPPYPFNYEVLKDGVVVLTGSAPVNSPSAMSLFGFTGGGFDELRLQVRLANSPIFRPGSIESGSYDSFAAITAVPEPSTWAMMLLGFAGVSFMAYRRSRKDQGLALAA
jgi:hypothetical protein